MRDVARNKYFKSIFTLDENLYRLAVGNAPKKSPISKLGSVHEPGVLSESVGNVEVSYPVIRPGTLGKLSGAFYKEYLFSKSRRRA
jgi:hypothetical protein